jgi:pimeloyl-ACP methyl ester carboxylesterase
VNSLAAFPNASFQVIPDAGHLVQEDNPAELTAAVLSFLQG